jgi:hypothetical protein
VRCILNPVEGADTIDNKDEDVYVTVPEVKVLVFLSFPTCREMDRARSFGILWRFVPPDSQGLRAAHRESPPAP